MNEYTQMILTPQKQAENIYISTDKVICDAFTNGLGLS